MEVVGLLVVCVGFNGPLRQYFGLYGAVWWRYLGVYDGKRRGRWGEGRHYQRVNT